MNDLAESLALSSDWVVGGCEKLEERDEPTATGAGLLGRDLSSRLGTSRSWAVPSR